MCGPFWWRAGVVPAFGVRFEESLQKLDFDPDIIAELEFPEAPPWTYQTAVVDLTLLYAKRDRVHHSRCLSLHGEVGDGFQDYHFICTGGSVSDAGLRRGQSLTVNLTLSVFRMSLLYSLQSCTLCTLLLMGWRQQMMMRGVLSFSQIQGLLFRPFRAKTGHILFTGFPVILAS